MFHLNKTSIFCITIQVSKKPETWHVIFLMVPADGTVLHSLMILIPIFVWSFVNNKPIYHKLYLLCENVNKSYCFRECVKVQAWTLLFSPGLIINFPKFPKNTTFSVYFIISFYPCLWILFILITWSSSFLTEFL